MHKNLPGFDHALKLTVDQMTWAALVCLLVLLEESTLERMLSALTALKAPPHPWLVLYALPRGSWQARCVCFIGWQNDNLPRKQVSHVPPALAAVD